MNSGCRRLEKSLVDFVEGTLPEILRAEIEEHIQNCEKCGLLVKEFFPIWQNMSTGERKVPSSSFWPGLVERIQTGEEPQKVWQQIISGFRRSLWPAAVTVLLLVGAYFGYQLGNIPEDTETSFSAEEYFVEYLEDFQDFPLGSVGDFYLKYSATQQGEAP